MTKKLPEISPVLVEELLDGKKSAGEILGPNGIIKQLTKALLEKALESELTEHLGYDKHSHSQYLETKNYRNGTTPKTLNGNDGAIQIDVPRDRNSDFEPQIIKKNQTRFDGFDDKIISLYARGMSTRDIQSQLEEIYGVEVSATLISNVTNEVIEQVKEWQGRSVDKLYPIVFFDALMIKVKEDKKTINKAFYLALGVNTQGQKELLGIWVSQNEGAKFWLNVLTELKNRGLEDIFIACVDGLKGFPEAIEAAFPKTQVQLCIVHMVRHSLRFVCWKNRKEVAADLRKIYSSATVEDAETALTEFSDKWDEIYPTISKSWLTHWHNITPFFDYPADIRKAIYTTNAIESLNASLRKVIKNKRVFPSDEAAIKLLFLALKNIAKKWSMPIHHWKSAMNQFAIMFEGRL